MNNNLKYSKLSNTRNKIHFEWGLSSWHSSDSIEKVCPEGQMKNKFQGKFAATIWKHQSIQPCAGYLFKTLSTHKFMSLFWLCNSIYVKEVSSSSFLYFVNFLIKYKQYLKCWGLKHHCFMRSRHSGCITSSNYTEQWKQPFPSPELLLLDIHYHSANRDREQYDNIKAIISRLYVQPYLNYICKNIIRLEN